MNVTAVTANIAATSVISGIENVNFTTGIAAGTAFTVAADKFAGVKALNITRSDLLDGSISGKGAVTVTGLDAAKVAAVNVVGNAAGAVIVTQVTTPGVKVTADGTGNVTLNGGGTVDAANSTGTITVDGTATAALAAGAVTVNAAKATTVNIGQVTEVKGAVTVNASKAATVAVTAAGGATITATEGVAAGTAITVSVTKVDDSGATITLGSSGSQNATTGAITRGATVNLDGSGTTDVATVKAGGFISVNAASATNAIDTLTFEGNGAALDVALTSANGALTTVNATGTQDVTVRADSYLVSAKTVSGVKKLVLDGAGAAAIALDKVALATDIQLSADIAQTITVASGANVTLANNQTNLTMVSKTDKGTVNLTVADNNAYDGLDATITTGATDLFTAGSTFSAVNINLAGGALSATTFDAGADGVVTVTGSKDLTITGGYVTNSGSQTAATTVAKSIDASALTGKVTMNIGAGVKTVTTGSAVDTLVVDDRTAASGSFVANGTVAYNINSGAGNDVLTLTSFGVASQFVTGDGNDNVTVGHANAAVISLGAGNDTATINADINSDAVLAGGEGTDKLVFLDTDGNDFSGNANFSFGGFEELDISALNDATKAITISAAQFNGQTFTLKGGAATDKLAIVGKADTDNVINASTITVDTAVVSIKGANKNDTLTGTASADIFVATAGTDVISGGNGNDTYDASAVGINGSTAVEGAGTGNQSGIVVNLSAAAITNTTIVAAGTGYTANTVTSVEAGKTAYLYAAAAATNSAVQQTLSSVENVTGTAGNDYIVGSTGANVITGGAGVDTMTGGAGADTFAYTSLATVKDQTGITLATADKITDFVSGTDFIKTGTAGTTGAGGNYSEAAAVADFATALAAASIAMTAGALYHLTSTAADGGLLFVDSNADGTADAVIKLTGITSANFAATDIIA